MLNSNLLRKLDMQDLMVFIAVYDQSSVTEVSETLFVSQSTVSYSLKKLRTSFEDELFINTRAGMRPTYKATTMYAHVQKILESINLCHAGGQAFDPTQKAVTFNVCAPEYFEQTEYYQRYFRLNVVADEIQFNCHLPDGRTLCLSLGLKQRFDQAQIALLSLIPAAGVTPISASWRAIRSA